MKRPELTEALIIEIIKRHPFINSQFDDEYQIEDIAHCFIKYKPTDGYEFMKELEGNYYYCGDMDMCELLEGVIGHIEQGYEENIKEWVAANGIKPKYQPGDEIPGTNMVVKDIDKYRPFTYQIQFKNTWPKVGSNSYTNLWFDQVEGVE